MSDERPNGMEDGLEPFFAAARAARSMPSDALVARILADAAAVSAGRETAARAGRIAAARGRGPGLLARLAGALGGWPAAAALAGCAVAGLLIGIAAPEEAMIVAALDPVAVDMPLGFDLMEAASVIDRMADTPDL